MRSLLSAESMDHDVIKGSPLLLISGGHCQRRIPAVVNTQSNSRDDGLGVSIGQFDGLQQVRG